MKLMPGQSWAGQSGNLRLESMYGRVLRTPYGVDPGTRPYRMEEPFEANAATSSSRGAVFADGPTGTMVQPPRRGTQVDLGAESPLFDVLNCVSRGLRKRVSSFQELQLVRGWEGKLVVN
jgi:hypothetical protein